LSDTLPAEIVPCVAGKSERSRKTIVLAGEGLPPETVRFIQSFISSVGQLEILLLLQASEGRAFTAAQLNDQLRSNLDAVERRVTALVRHGFVAAESTPGTYRYAPASEDLRAGVAQLVECYRNYSGRVIDAIYSVPDPMQLFSDAFRIKKDEGDKHG